MTLHRKTRASRLPLAVTLIAAAFISAFLIATFSNKGADYWVVNLPISPGHQISSSDVSIDSITGEITLSNILSSITGDVVFIPQAYQNIEVLISSETTSEFYGLNKPAYIIEEISTDDYVVETTGGNISFLSPLDAGVGIEVEYYIDENTQIVEPILFTIQNETTTKINSSKYSFNPNAYTIEQTVSPQVYVGAEIVGIFDNTKIPSFDYTTNILTLPSENTEDYTVKISYSVKQAIGGEYTIKVVNPIWLPLMQITKGSTGFDIYGDYTNIIKANSVIKSTTEFFVVDTATYANGKTTITFDTPAKFDSGARSPSDDPKIFVLSNENIFISLSSLTGNNNHVINAKPLSSNLTISEDITALQNSSTMPVALPSCSYFLSIPYTPGRKLISAGLPIALASDYNPGSTPSGNMNFVLSTACIKMKITPEEAINAATINGAYAMNLSETHGSITIGKKANIIMTKPITSFYQLPYEFGDNLIEKVMIEGKFVE